MAVVGVALLRVSIAACEPRAARRRASAGSENPAGQSFAGLYHGGFS